MEYAPGLEVLGESLVLGGRLASGTCTSTHAKHLSGFHKCKCELQDPRTSEPPSPGDVKFVGSSKSLFSLSARQCREGLLHTSEEAEP